MAESASLPTIDALADSPHATNPTSLLGRGRGRRRGGGRSRPNYEGAPSRGQAPASENHQRRHTGSRTLTSQPSLPSSEPSTSANQHQPEISPQPHVDRAGTFRGHGRGRGMNQGRGNGRPQNRPQALNTNRQEAGQDGIPRVQRHFQSPRMPRNARNSTEIEPGRVQGHHQGQIQIQQREPIRVQEHRPPTGARPPGDLETASSGAQIQPRVQGLYPRPHSRAYPRAQESRGRIQRPGNERFGQQPVRRGAQEQPESPGGLPLSLSRLAQEIQEKLVKGAVECMVCLSTVGRMSPTWSCATCYAIFHLHCIKKWAQKLLEGGEASWRCPGCQAPQESHPHDIVYTCFCAKVKNPDRNDYLTPHSCGEPCGRQLGNARCPHTCSLQCHPGPCPPCTSNAPTSFCHCGRRQVVVRCSEQKEAGESCGEACGRQLACGRHFCSDICHEGSCAPCGASLVAPCHCGRHMDSIACCQLAPGEDSTSYSCQETCDRPLECGNHRCTSVCHLSPCPPCQLAPSQVDTCPCGKTQVFAARASCLDPIPTCESTCEKMLPCGDHSCPRVCHEGPCGTCQVEVRQLFRCGETSRKVRCCESSSTQFLCEKKCGRKMNCGRHRCPLQCCPREGFDPRQGPDLDPHFCTRTCDKKLRCGAHTCQFLCHAGHCQPCAQTGFSELACACGKTVIQPPVPCGTPVPTCPLPCLLPRPCAHPPGDHDCHFGDCPPCLAPVSRLCAGGHVSIRGIRCGTATVTCSNACGRQLACGKHACIRSCHAGDCLPAGGACTQPCTLPRRACAHPCGAPCHPAQDCPQVPCQALVPVSCPCWRITAQVPCGDGSEPRQKQPTCDDECARLAKNRLLAEAFQPFEGVIAGSDALSEASRKEPQWLSAIESRLCALALGSTPGPSHKPKFRVHVFKPMPWNKREALHSLAERWGLGSISTGSEPRRMVIAYTTHKTRAPARMVASRGDAPSPGQAPCPPLSPDFDLDPGCVLTLFDLPRESNVSTQLLRFGGECDLVWIDQWDAIVVFGDLQRAATALRYLEHAKPYWGANQRPAPGTVAPAAAGSSGRTVSGEPVRVSAMAAAAPAAARAPVGGLSVAKNSFAMLGNGEEGKSGIEGEERSIVSGSIGNGGEESVEDWEELVD